MAHYLLSIFVVLISFPAFASSQEIYLVGGGAGCIAIERDAQDKATLAYGSIPYSTSTTRWLLHEEGKTSMSLQVHEADSRTVYGFQYYRFARAADGGNWDLKIADQQNAMNQPERYDPPDPTAAFPAYLYRLDEPLLVEHFKLLARADVNPDRTTSETLAAVTASAGKLLSAHPDNPYIHVLYFDALMRTNSDAELEKRFAEWETGLRKSTAAHRWMAEVIKTHITSRKLSAAGKNARDLVWALSDMRADLSTCFRRYSELLNYDVYLQPQSPFTGRQQNFLHTTILAKTMRVLGQFAEMKGRRSEGLRAHVASYRLGMLMTAEHDWIGRLIGTALRTIATHALFIYAASTCETEAEFAELWALLERQLSRESIPSIHPDVTAYGKLIASVQYKYKQDEGTADLEYRVRKGVADSKFNLLRTGTAALYIRARTGQFPQSDSGFAPFLKAPDVDPFQTTSTIKCMLTPTTFTCYSVGPDEKDGYALIDYDPTNGTVSAGDIAWRIPKEREFPYPRTGLRGATREDVLRYLPNGLPPDPFANTRGRAYGISNTRPVAIYSFGPDGDESTASQGTQQMQEAQRYGYYTRPDERLQFYVPEVHYDPTNGTVSEGDIFTVLPP